jgi:hypothetical protein
MNRLLFLVLAAALVSVSVAGADDAVNKLMAGHDQAVRAAALPLHRKLLTELQKLETQYTKAGQKIPLAETQAEIARVKQWITDASQPVGSGTGPQPGDYKIVYSSGDSFILGSWDNGDLKPLPRGFAWTNKGQAADITHTTVLTGAFEAEFVWKGKVYTLCLTEADYTKYVQLYYPAPVDEEKHTLKVKRTAAGAISAELDGKPITYSATNGARQDMHIRFLFRVLKDSTVEFREANIKDLSTKK